MEAAGSGLGRAPSALQPVATDRLGTGRPQLVVVESLELTTALDPYLSLRALAAYSGCSVRWLRDRLTDPYHPLPCFRLPGGKVLVRCSEFDGWLARHRRVGNPDVDRLVAETLNGFRLPRPSSSPS